MKAKVKDPNQTQGGLQLLKGILDSPRVQEHPEFIGAQTDGDDIVVTVMPKTSGALVTIRLGVVSTTSIPHRPRRGRT